MRQSCFLLWMPMQQRPGREDGALAMPSCGIDRAPAWL